MKKKIKPSSAPIKIDIGCGPNKREGFIGVDVLPFGGKVDVVMDVRKTPWPWKDGEVEEVHCSHFLEHLSGPERIEFFNELYRVMKTGAKMTIVVPHWSSGRAYGDPTHKWPPVVEFSFYYLSKEWRATNAPHVGFKCDFEVTWGYAIAGAWNVKSQEAQAFAVNHYREVAQDLTATAVKK
ncbi:MAG: methyltransferase domain-containing protein [Nitrospira sp.]|nr:methyltransferase domain-containing protein [Nitrospira sp.]